MIRIVAWILFLIGGSVSGIAIDKLLFVHLFKNLWFHSITFVFGLIILRVVMIISRNTGRYLARYGRMGNIPKMETNRLVKSGMYSCMRHPMHFGLLFFPLAFAFIIGSPSFILIIAPIEIIIMIIMIKLIEETEAIKKFGNEYREYMKKVPMFSLRKECLRLLFVKKEKITAN